MKIDAEIVTFTISIMFALLGIFDYLIFSEPYYPLWIVSFIALLATVGMWVIERSIEGVIDEDVLKDLDELEDILKPKTD